MKIYLCVVGILCTLVLVKCESPQEIKKLFDECAKEVGLSEDVFKGPPNFDDPKVKCFSACLMKKLKTLVDGKIVAEKAVEFTDKELPGGATDTIKADVKECASKANEEKDECDVAGTFEKCFMKKHPFPND